MIISLVASQGLQKTAAPPSVRGHDGIFAGLHA